MKRSRSVTAPIAAIATQGGLLATAAKSLIPGGLGSVVAVTGTSRALNDLLATTSAVELRIINRDKLLAMDFNADLVELFLDNPMFTPTYQTYLVGALEQMEGVRGRQALVKYAIPTQDEDVAFYRTRIAWLYALYHRDVSELDRFVAIAKGAVAVSTDNRLVLSAAVDHIVWTETMATIIEAVEAGVANESKVEGKHLWTTGTMTEKTKQVLEDRGWSIGRYVKQ